MIRVKPCGSARPILNTVFQKTRRLDGRFFRFKDTEHRRSAAGHEGSRGPRSSQLFLDFGKIGVEPKRHRFKIIGKIINDPGYRIKSGDLILYSWFCQSHF